MTDIDKPDEPSVKPGEQDDARPFTAFLADYQRGTLNSELGEKLRDVVAEVTEHGKAGELTLRIKVKPAGANAGGQLTVAADVSTKTPQPEPEAQIFFADDRGELHRNDPHANPLFNREDI